MMKRKAIVLILLLAIIIGGYTIWQARKVEEQNGVLTLYGNVDIRDVALGFRVAGRISAMQFEEGDKVKQGTILATLDKTPFEESLAVAKAELAEAEAVRVNAEKSYLRRAELVKTGGVSKSDFDEAFAARDQAVARVATARAHLDQAQTQLEDTEIHSPSHGTILTRVCELGSIVAVGAPVYTLALDNPVWIRTYVDESNLGNIYPGQKANVSTDSGGSYEGQIGFISPQAEFTPKNVETTQLRTNLVYRLRIIVDNPDNGLRQGMPITVTIDKRKPRQ
jgi:HlyD family secretion protein